MDDAQLNTLKGAYPDAFRVWQGRMLDRDNGDMLVQASRLEIELFDIDNETNEENDHG